MIMNLKIKKIFIANLFLFLVTALGYTPIVFAQDKECPYGKLEVPIPGIEADFLCKKPSLVKYVNVLINFITALIVIIGLISIIIGGYFYMTAGGNSDRISTAKQFIEYALIGIALALMAWAILNTIGPQFTTDIKDPIIKN